MWGQEEVTQFWVIFSRIIPTRVGTSGYDDVAQVLNEDHPHACGDKLYFGIISFILVGSSPRVWGQVDVDFTVDLSDRIIPTRVGTRAVYLFAYCLLTDHPHACGDKFHDILFSPKLVGSSPRVWGQGSFYGGGYSV